MEIVDADRCRELWPLIRSDDLQGGAWVPGDGRVDPLATTRALAAGASAHGAAIAEGVRVTEILVDGARATGGAQAAAGSSSGRSSSA